MQRERPLHLRRRGSTSQSSRQSALLGRRVVSFRPTSQFRNGARYKSGLPAAMSRPQETRVSTRDSTYGRGLTSLFWVFWAIGLISALGSVVWNVITVSLRQSPIPDQLLGRVNSVYRFVGWGTIPLGSLLGGIDPGRGIRAVVGQGVGPTWARRCGRSSNPQALFLCPPASQHTPHRSGTNQKQPGGSPLIETDDS